MKYLKYFESKIEDIDNISYEMTHEKIRECAEIIKIKANINRDNGFESWLTHNWCFNHNPNEEFFCKLYFHLIKKSDSVRLLKRYLLSNHITFEANDDISFDADDNKMKEIVVSFSITKEQILYYLIENKNSNLSKMEIEMEIDNLLEEERIDKTSNKYDI